MANSCECPTPPGGLVVCSDDQIAFCRVSDGQTVSGCISTPPDLAQFLATSDAGTVMRTVAAAAGVTTDVLHLEVSELPQRWLFNFLESDEGFTRQAIRGAVASGTFTVASDGFLDARTNELVRGDVRLSVTLPRVRSYFNT